MLDEPEPDCPEVPEPDWLEPDCPDEPEPDCPDEPDEPDCPLDCALPPELDCGNGSPVAINGIETALKISEYANFFINCTP